MRRSDFEKRCIDSRLRPVRRLDAPGGVILIADSGGISPRDLREKTDEHNHYCTLWAHGKDEDNLEIGQSLYFKAFYEDNGLWHATTEDVRVRAAEQIAREWLNARS